MFLFDKTDRSLLIRPKLGQYPTKSDVTSVISNPVLTKVLIYRFCVFIFPLNDAFIETFIQSHLIMYLGTSIYKC